MPYLLIIGIDVMDHMLNDDKIDAIVCVCYEYDHRIIMHVLSVVGNEMCALTVRTLYMPYHI